MSNIRIKDLTTTASSPASDDYLPLDGTSNGTRKIKATDINSDTTYVIGITGGVITLTDSDGGTSTATLPVYSGGVS